MKIKLLFLLISFWSFSQNRPIEIKIDSITSKDSNEYRDREFTIVYHIKNLSNNEVSFFLNTKKFIPSSASSMQYVPTYRLYQNETPIDLGQVFTSNRIVFTSKDFNQQSVDEYLKNRRDSIKLEYEKINSDPEYAWQKNNKAIMNSIFILKPNETKQFVQQINWDKKRYLKSHDLEYYFDENHKYFLELELTLLKSEFQDRLTKEELESIMKNENFIKGNYKSNKVEINFKE